MDELIYVYCLSDTKPELSRDAGFAGLKCIATGNLHAVVKMVPESEFSEENLKRNLSDLAWLDVNARAHVRIINLLMEDCTVIPFNFGTIYRSEETLNKFIADYSCSLVDNLLFVEWKAEWTVKIYSNHEILRREIDNISAEAADLEKQIMSSSPGKAFLMGRKKAVLVESEINRLNKFYGSACYDEMKKHTVSAVINNLVPKEFTGRNDEMILHATFLVHKDSSIDFVSTVRSLKNRYSDLGFDNEITGPWPPFSFISIKENQ